MAGVETKQAGLTVKDLCPNPVHRIGFHLGTVLLGVASHIQAEDQASALRAMHEVLDDIDRDGLDEYLDEYAERRRNEIFEERHMNRWASRCEEVVNKAIGSVSAQRLALRFLEDTQE